MLAHGHLAATAATAATGQLNPDWVEALMGWPQGWTSLEPLDADVWQHWLCTHRWQDWEHSPCYGSGKRSCAQIEGYR
jgi:hypothetical protein